MTTRIWNVKFGGFTNINVVASNIKAAINQARKIRKGKYSNRIQDITEVVLLAESTYDYKM